MLKDIEHYFGDLCSIYSIFSMKDFYNKDLLEEIEKHILKPKNRVFFHGINFKSGLKSGLVIRLDS